MSVVREEMFDLHEGVVTAAEIFVDVTANDLWDNPKYKTKSKVA